jgi:hypothetical protein
MLVSRTADQTSVALDAPVGRVSGVEPSRAFADYYRCSSEFARFEVAELSADEGYFRFGDAVGYGRYHRPSGLALGPAEAPDLVDLVGCQGGKIRLPFDLSEAIANLRGERYHRPASQGLWFEVYYALRPLLPIGVRRHLQRFRLRDWKGITFPQWPVDFSVENLMAGAMALQLKATGLRQIPFIWFWPEGAPSCAIMTHDVEDRVGRDFCEQLMDLDDSFGIKSAFQVVPEIRYGVSQPFLDRFRERGFEVNVHDLNHDGHLFRTREHFVRRAARINEYGAKFQSRGFRAGAMYRKQEWFDALEFAYDMSVPNVAHLEPQRGGCCTVMPYFIGDLLELPLTTVQDYSLFHILNDYSISLWKVQSELILENHGLISFITHPDYLTAPRARRVYLKLLAYLRELRDERGVWFALPGDVERWWRNRSRMSLVRAGDHWKIEGPDADRARVAFASLEDDEVVYSFS